VKRAPLIGGAVLLVLGTLAGVYYMLPGLSRSRAPSTAELARLVKERNLLRDEFSALLTQQQFLDFAQAPAGNVLVGVPNVISERLVSQVVTGLLSEVRLHLTNLRAHAEDDVQANVLFKQRTVGRFSLDVDIKDLRAVLKPGDPDLKFGQDRIGIQLPVHVTEGRARGNVHFRWDGQGLAGAVCGDVDVSPDVSSRVRPATYMVKGDFLLSARGDTVVAEPDFPPILLDLRLDPGTREVTRGARAIRLTRTEFALLELLMLHPRQVLGRDRILEQVWGYDFPTTANSLEVYVGYLRRKTEAEGEARLIHTVRGVGYVLKES